MDDGTNDSPWAFFSAQDERARRWRLILGQDADEAQDADASDGAGESATGPADENGLSEQDQRLDQALESLYGDSNRGDLSDSNPDIARRLGDIRQYFPQAVVQVMQRDALQKVKLRRMLADPDILHDLDPDVALVSDLLALSRVMPAKTKDTAKEVVRQVVEKLMAQLELPMYQAITGSIHRSLRARRPRHKEINWSSTIYKNLKHYQPRERTVVPETLVGYGRKRSSLRDIILCVDTSGSMARSVVYAGVYASVMASIPSLSTRLILFDTSVVDLTAQLQDPVDLIFGIRLGGGTHIGKALGYCQQVITRPRESTVILISDLFEGARKEGMRRQMARLVADGVQVIVLLALNDDGAPRFDRQAAADFVEMGVPSFACTPDLFPDLMSAVLNGRDIGHWAAVNNIVTAPDN